MTKTISGIYAIHNKVNDKYYIGSSNNIVRRLKKHKLDLQKGSHDNRLLQKEFDFYGSHSFELIVLLEGISEEELTAYEKVFIYLYDSIVLYKGYNVIFPTTNHELFKKAYNNLLQEGYIDRITKR